MNLKQALKYIQKGGMITRKRWLHGDYLYWGKHTHNDWKSNITYESILKFMLDDGGNIYEHTLKKLGKTLPKDGWLKYKG